MNKVLKYLNEIDTTENFLVCDILSKITTKFKVVEIFDEILQDKDFLENISLKSYSHFNGFDKISIFSGNSFKLRVHIWWKQSTSKNNLENIHDHRWDFCSLILNGSYISQEFEQKSNGHFKHLYHYYSVKDLKSYALSYKGKSKIKKINEIEYTKGMINKGFAGDIHRVLHNRRIDLITLFVTTNYNKDYALVYSEKPIINFEDIPATPILADKLKEKLMTIKEILLGQSNFR